MSSEDTPSSDSPNRDSPDAQDESTNALPSSSPGEDSVSADTPDEEQTSCLPAVVAATLLMGIVAFITCGITTWVLFQNRPAIAIRTLDGYIPVVQQSRLDPEEKSLVIDQLEEVRQRLEAGILTPADASAVMERLVRLPIPQWGELSVVESYIETNWDGSQKQAGLEQLSRLRRAVEIDRATVVDVNRVLDPVTTNDPDSPLGRTLNEPLRDADVLEVVDRAGLIGDRAEIENRLQEKASIANILRQRLAETLGPTID